MTKSYHFFPIRLYDKYMVEAKCRIEKWSSSSLMCIFQLLQKKEKEIGTSKVAEDDKSLGNLKKFHIKPGERNTVLSYVHILIAFFKIKKCYY